MPDEKLFFEDLAEGASAPEVSHTLTRTDLVMYAGASGDFNPMHTDEVSAKEAGLPSVFGHGMLTAGILATAVTGYVGVGNLRNYKVRFTKQTWPGETLTTRVVVRKKYDDHGEHRVDLECTVVNQDGEAKLTGVAVAALPAGVGSTMTRFDLPSPDLETQPFWDAAKEERLLIRHCTACGQYHFYPRPFCPSCWSEAVEWYDASGLATLYTWSVVYQNDLPPWPARVPYVAAVVDLAEGPRMQTNVIDCEFDALADGMELEVVFQATSEDFTIPVFRPATAQ